MSLSAFSVVDSYPEFGDGGRDRYRELLDLAPILESSGFRALWVAEHHFHDGGVCPSPTVLLAAAGERTHRLRLGAMVCVLPFHRPISVAEEYGLLDQILGGRLDLGTGSGYLPQEFEGFGIDPATKRERFDRGLETIVAAFRGEEISGEDGAGRKVRLNVRPRQRPHPPLWIAAQRREAIPHVARRGLNLGLVPYATVPDLAGLREVVREYRSALPTGAVGTVSAALHLYAGAHPERARHALQRYLDSRLATQSTHYQHQVRQHPETSTVAGLEAIGLAVIGTPEEARAGLDRFLSTGVDEVLAMLDFGGLPADEVAASARALGPGPDP